MNKTRFISWILFAVTPVFFTGCSRTPEPNLLLIIVDTLRLDHVGCYGYTRSVSPAIDSLAREGFRFTNAYSTAPWTQPSVGSILTGLYPRSHSAFRMRRSLPDSAVTLAEILRDSGYATAGVVSHFLIGAKYNFDQGFETFVEDAAQGHDHISTPEVTDSAVELLEMLSTDESPFFLYVHYFDPHFDYMRHPECGYAKESAGRLDGNQAIQELRELDPPPSEEEAAFIRDLYDEEISSTDAGIGQLLSAVERLGLKQNTDIVLTSDHGEEFFERGWVGHTRTLYDELVRIPLIFRMPSGQGSHVIEDLVSLVSLPQTLLDLLGIHPSSMTFQGISFAPLLAGDSLPTSPVYCEVDFSDRPAARGPDDGLSKKVQKHAMVREGFKLVYDRFKGEFELYNLRIDPDELENLVDREPMRLEELSAELESLAREAGSRVLGEKIREPSETELDQLRSLGYIK